MFCDQCGAALESGQRFCKNCAKEVVGPTIPGYPRRSRVLEHVRLLGILWIALSALNVIGGGVLLVLANTIFWRFQGPEMSRGHEFLHLLLTMAAFFVLAKAVVGLIAGVGLLQRAPWARILALVLAFLSLINPPFGTALGIYTLWVLLPSASEEEYQRYQTASAA
jgi:hypothetical protein